ncbi:MAG: acylphosphatase [Actinomycetota bacterium]|nr:acylphosphatase [Actinomycetota bacterium]
MRRVRVVVRGLVQGVFFRASAARLARELGLAGSVSNRPDGAVEAIFAGEPDAVERMIAWCRRGPELAEVDSVEVSEEPGDVVDSDFRVS